MKKQTVLTAAVLSTGLMAGQALAQSSGQAASTMTALEATVCGISGTVDNASTAGLDYVSMYADIFCNEWGGATLQINALNGGFVNGVTPLVTYDMSVNSDNSLLNKNFTSSALLSGVTETVGPAGALADAGVDGLAIDVTPDSSTTLYAGTYAETITFILTAIN